MLARVSSATVIGLNAHIINVEVDSCYGLGRHVIVGLPDTAVKESKERIEAAITNSGLDVSFFRRVTVNLAPADLKKEGPSFDLPIAIAFLATERLVNPDKLNNKVILGELSLNGQVQPVRGILSMALEARERGFTEILIPADNAEEGSMVRDLRVIPIRNLLEAVEYLTGKIEIEPYNPDLARYQEKVFPGDFAEVKGQYLAKRALEIAAAGGHNVLMIGSPGCGKTMLAKRFNTILPPLTYEESIEVSKIYSVAGLLKQGLIRHRQFRAPHHTTSDVAIVGGGRLPRPGEISLAHLGVLFLDEFPEFDRSVLEVLRQPLEDGEVTISRALMALTYPAKFILLAAMNPCACGYAADQKKECRCSTSQVASYWKKLSGPILDRIDLIVEVPTLAADELAQKSSGETSAAIRERVKRARKIQLERFQGQNGIYVNADMSPRDVQLLLKNGLSGQELIAQAVEKYNFSGRSYDRVLKVARTIADLSGSSEINEDHLAEALQYKLNNFYVQKN